MKKLPEKFKKDWVEALRSGKYAQVHQTLRGYFTDDEGNELEDFGYCCLGVACVVNRPEQELDLGLDMPSEMLIDHEILDVFLQEVPKPNTVAGNDYEQLMFKLAAMNDGGKSFAEIADYIEENL